MSIKISLILISLINLSKLQRSSFLNMRNKEICSLNLISLSKVFIKKYKMSARKIPDLNYPNFLVSLIYFIFELREEY